MSRHWPVLLARPEVKVEQDRPLPNLFEACLDLEEDCNPPYFDDFNDENNDNNYFDLNPAEERVWAAVEYFESCHHLSTPRRKAKKVLRPTSRRLVRINDDVHLIEPIRARERPVFSPSLPAASRQTPPPPPVLEMERRYEADLRAAVAASKESRHVSGLSMTQLLELSNRDLTPEDYELLLLLDSQLPKKVATPQALSRLESFELSGPELIGERCLVCLADLEAKELVCRLPCHGHHVFHDACVRTWLTSHGHSCPTCADPLA